MGVITTTLHSLFQSVVNGLYVDSHHCVVLPGIPAPVRHHTRYSRPGTSSYQIFQPQLLHDKLLASSRRHTRYARLDTSSYQVYQSRWVVILGIPDPIPHHAKYISPAGSSYQIYQTQYLIMLIIPAPLDRYTRYTSTTISSY